MDVVINGEEKKVEENSTLKELIEKLGVADKVMAAAVNMEIVKKKDWATHRLQEGDRVELLHFVGGG